MTKKILKTPYISIIIPLYNEKRRLNNLLKIYAYFQTTKLSYEVILVNDGSQDQTANKLNELSKNLKFSLISYQNNQGKGFAIKTGILTAKGSYLLFTDIDLSTPIEEFNKFLPYLKENTVLIGSRKIMGSKLDKRQPYLRETLGKGFTFLSQKLLNLNIKDFTCGFKCFPKKIAFEVFSKQKIERWGFDSEILFLAKKYGYKIKEIPVKWSNDPGSKVRFPLDIMVSLMDLLTVRYNELRKKYDNKN